MTQLTRLAELPKDGKPHRTDEILREVYGSEHLGIARVGARQIAATSTAVTDTDFNLEIAPCHYPFIQNATVTTFPEPCDAPMTSTPAQKICIKGGEVNITPTEWDYITSEKAGPQINVMDSDIDITSTPLNP
jgi:hypothetical protein